jgi:hypothetical protein
MYTTFRELDVDITALGRVNSGWTVNSQGHFRNPVVISGYLGEEVAFGFIIADSFHDA